MVPSFKYWHYIVGVVSRINPIRHSPDKTIPLPALLPKYLLWGGSYFSQISEDVIHANLLLSFVRCWQKYENSVTASAAGKSC